MACCSIKVETHIGELVGIVGNPRCELVSNQFTTSQQLFWVGNLGQQLVSNQFQTSSPSGLRPFIQGPIDAWTPLAKCWGQAPEAPRVDALLKYTEYRNGAQSHRHVRQDSRFSAIISVAEREFHLVTDSSIQSRITFEAHFEDFRVTKFRLNFLQRHLEEKGMLKFVRLSFRGPLSIRGPWLNRSWCQQCQEQIGRNSEDKDRLLRGLDSPSLTASTD